MITQGERIKILRTEMKMTLEKFGSRLGVGKTAISKIEKGERGLTDQMFISICREFNVNPSWLRDGSGEMFVERSRDDEIENFINSVLTDEPDSFRRRLIAVLSRLSTDDWELLERMAREMAAEHDKEDERKKLHEELDRQLDLEETTRKSSESSAG